MKLIGNCIAAAEAGARTEYQSNSLNQYTAEGSIVAECSILWNSTQPTATRPLAIQKNRTWYTYTPYGEVTPAHADAQPLRWSSEYHDPELGLVYYNYRHYNPTSGRWTGRDAIPRSFLYDYAWNNPLQFHDYLGLLNLSQNQPDVPTAPTAPTVVMLPSAKTGVDCSICESKLPDIRDYIRNTYKNIPSHDLCCSKKWHMDNH